MGYSAQFGVLRLCRARRVDLGPEIKFGGPMKILLTSVFVDSPIDAFKFYTEVLGFVERLYMPEANLAIVASPEEPGGTRLLLEPNDNPIAKTYQEAIYDA